MSEKETAKKEWIKAQDIIINPVDGFFDFEHLCRVHETIFQDIYDWAGVPRTIPIEKSELVLGGLSVEYAEPGNIERDTMAVLKILDGAIWNQMIKLLSIQNT